MMIAKLGAIVEIAKSGGVWSDNVKVLNFILIFLIFLLFLPLYSENFVFKSLYIVIE